MRLLQNRDVRFTAGGGSARQRIDGRFIWRCRGSLLGLAVMGVFIDAGHCDAQNGSGLGYVGRQGINYAPELPSMPLTVRPRAIVLGTRTPRAGEYQLDSIPGSPPTLAYVPQQCVGSQRCPLLLFLHALGGTGKSIVKALHPVADKYGMILLAPTSPGAWHGDIHQDQRNVDASLQQALRMFAIDLKRIALLGNSAGGGATIAFGGDRLDLFSRILLVSTDYSIANVDPRNRTATFLITDGIDQSRSVFDQAMALEQTGHPAQMMLNLLGHGTGVPDWDWTGRWLQDSWATKPASHQVHVTSVVRLTPEAVNKMTHFWRQFGMEPDSIRTTAKLAHMREVVVPVGKEHPTVLMVDMQAMAAQYPSVAADLQAAGLTVEQETAYRVALVSARIANSVKNGVDVDHSDRATDSLDRLESRCLSSPSLALAATSVQGENLTLLTTQVALAKALAATDVLDSP